MKTASLVKQKPIATEIQVDQGTPEWFEARLGCVTASRMNDVMAKTAAPRDGYRGELVYERLTGQQWQSFQSRDMAFGSEQEEVARTMYLLKTGNKVRECGFYRHNDMLAGASPDGMLVDYNGSIEIKVPRLHNHIATLKTGKIPKQYERQVQYQMFMNGCEFVDFVSYSPFLPGEAQLFVVRVNRDADTINDMAAATLKFLDEVQDDLEFIENYGK